MNCLKVHVLMVAMSLKYLIKIIFPVIIPGVATQAIFTFVGCWNSYVQPSILLFSQEKFTLPILVQQMQGDTKQIME